MFWKFLCIHRALVTIALLNNGRFPSLFMEWRRVARRLGLEIIFLRRSDKTAYLVDTLLFVQPNRDCHTLNRQLAHEITEYILRHETIGEEWVTPAEYEDYHAIAHAVESLLHPFPIPHSPLP